MRIVGVIFNYLFSIKFVYKGNNQHIKTKKRLSVFLILFLIGLLFQNLGIYICCYLFKLNEWLTKIILAVVYFIFNYIKNVI